MKNRSERVSGNFSPDNIANYKTLSCRFFADYGTEACLSKMKRICLGRIVLFTIKAKQILWNFVSLARVPYNQSKKSRLLGFVMSVMLPEKFPDTLSLRPSNIPTNLKLWGIANSHEYAIMFQLFVVYAHIEWRYIVIWNKKEKIFVI